MLHRPILVALAILIVLGGAAWGQESSSGSLTDLTEFDAGDLDYRTHVYMDFASKAARAAVLVPGFGLSGLSFREQPDGDPSWARMLQQRGWNAFSLDQVGTGRTLPTPSDDLLTLLEKGLWGVYQIGMATQPTLYLAHGQAAGMALKARSFDPLVGKGMVLIDPIGPQGVQETTDLTPQQLLERRHALKDAVWREWGFGPRYGELRQGLDLTLEEAKALVEGYEPDQPAYWTGLLTGMDSDYAVREPIKLGGLPVLVIRTPAADREQVEREESVRRWLDRIGTEVSFLDLEAQGLGDVSGLPWAGDRAEQVLDRILAWWEEASAPESGDEAQSR